ncbi:MAG: peptidase M23 [Gemmatimonadetes bacterium 21-71-4]|nr:MAG: peptidase M23 [Gemmatimonadetes bacterium 21-71-4]
MPRGSSANLSRLITRSAALAAVVASVASGQQPSGSGTWAAVTQAIGRSGTLLAGGVMKYGFPRSDLHVTVGDVSVKPALALGGWVAFEMTGPGRAMAMGDLVLTPEEVAPVMRALQSGGVDQTALHNHLLGENPRLMYMHVMGMGDPVKIATAIRDALKLTGTPAPPSNAPAVVAGAIDLDTAAIARALGRSGAVIGGVYQVGVPRAERITDAGAVIPPTMGVATGINFQPTGGGRAAITWDFVLLPNEVNPVIRALMSHGIRVTAIHSHMLDERPRIFFMHFWANGNAVALARGVRSALDLMHVRQP